MNNALSDIFHNQTALTRERLSFCEANIKDLNEWVCVIYPFTTTQIYAILLKLFSIELEQAVRGEIFLLVLVIPTLFSNVLIVGQAAVSYLDYSNY